MSYSWLWYLSVIPALGFLIFVHELGHFVTAIKMGIKVEEFGFGYPPRMLTLFHYRGVPVTINWLPLGGFVRMAGEEGNFNAEGSLSQAPPWKKIPVMAAGSIMNLLTAILLFAIVAGVGMPNPIGEVAIRDVVAGAPAAGKLQPGDVVLKIDGQAVDSPKKLRDLIEERAGRDVTLDVKSTRSDGVTELKPVIIRPRTKAERGPNDGALGVRPYVPADKVTTVQYVNGVGPLQAIVAGVQTTFRLLLQMLAGLGMLLASLFGFVQAPEGRVGGPILIAQMTGEIGQSEGLLSLISWTALLSVNLALFNLLPIPALDGSRIVFALIEWIRGGKRVPPEREAMVHAIGMVLLLGLMLVISIADVRYWLGGINALGG